jgi:hypothetical protein
MLIGPPSYTTRNWLPPLLLLLLLLLLLGSALLPASMLLLLLLLGSALLPASLLLLLGCSAAVSPLLLLLLLLLVSAASCCCCVGSGSAATSFAPFCTSLNADFLYIFSRCFLRLRTPASLEQQCR